MIDEKTILGLKNKRMELHTDPELFVKEYNEDKSKVFLILNKDNSEVAKSIDKICIYDNGELRNIIEIEKSFNMIMDTEFDYNSKDKMVVLVIDDNASCLVFNQSWIQVSRSDTNLIINIIKETDDLIALGSMKDISLPRIETVIVEDNDTIKGSFNLHYDLEKAPFEITTIYGDSDDKGQVMFDIEKMKEKLSNNINMILTILCNNPEELVIFMKSRVYKIQGNDENNIKLKKLEVFNQNIQWYEMALVLVDIIEDIELIYNTKDNNILIYNNHIINIDSEEYIARFNNDDFYLDMIKCNDRMSYMINYINFIEEKGFNSNEDELVVDKYIQEIDKYIEDLKQYRDEDLEYSPLDSVVVINGSILSPHTIVELINYTRQRLIEAISDESK